MSNDSVANAQESTWQRYRRLVSGKGRWGSFFFEQMILSLFSQLPGPVGLAVRRLLYPSLLGQFGKNAMIDHSVEIRCPSQIQLGANCIVESSVQLLAGSTTRPSIVLGNGSYIRSFSILNAGSPDGYIKLGRRSNLAHHVVVHGHGGVTIGEDVMIASGCSLIASAHRHKDTAKPISQQGFTASGIQIGDGAWLGTGVKVLDGVSIGQGSIVGAGSVVLENIPASSVAVGVPARVRHRR